MDVNESDENTEWLGFSWSHLTLSDWDACAVTMCVSFWSSKLRATSENGRCNRVTCSSGCFLGTNLSRSSSPWMGCQENQRYEEVGQDSAEAHAHCQCTWRSTSRTSPSPTVSSSSSPKRRACVKISDGTKQLRGRKNMRLRLPTNTVESAPPIPLLPILLVSGPVRSVLGQEDVEDKNQRKKRSRDGSCSRTWERWVCIADTGSIFTGIIVRVCCVDHSMRRRRRECPGTSIETKYAGPQETPWPGRFWLLSAEDASRSGWVTVLRIARLRSSCVMPNPVSLAGRECKGMGERMDWILEVFRLTLLVSVVFFQRHPVRFSEIQIACSDCFLTIWSTSCRESDPLFWTLIS